MKLTIETLINESGFRRNYIAELLGISEQALCHKVKGRRRFTELELRQLSIVLEVHLRIVRRAAEAVRGCWDDEVGVEP